MALAEVRVRQVRVLIYEGPAEEVRRMVTAEGRYVYGRREFPEGDLIMRKSGDRRPDTIVKAELYKGEVVAQRGEAKLVVEDRKAVVEMWRALGILTLQPKDGDY